MSFEIQETGNPTYAEVAEVFSRAREVLVVDGWAQGESATNGPKCAAGALAVVISGETAQMYGVVATPENPQLRINGVYVDPDPDVVAIVDILRQETGYPDGMPYRWNDGIRRKTLDMRDDLEYEAALQVVLKKFDEIIEKYQLLASPS